MKKVLITGCEGFIGSSLWEHLENNGFDVFGIDIACLDSKNKFKIDINSLGDLENIVLKISPDYIVHLAARIDISSDPSWKYFSNTLGVNNLIFVSNKVKNLRRIIFTSTQLVNKLGDKFINYENYTANTSYGESKVIGELLVRSKIIEKEWIIVRPSTVWGPKMGNHYLNFFKYINRGLYFNVTNKKCFKSFSYIGNLIFQMEKLLLADSHLVNKKTFYLSDYKPLELQNWTKNISINLNNKKVYSIPIQLSLLIGWAFKILIFLKLIKKAPISIYNIKNISTSYVNNNDLLKITGPLPYNLNDAIIETTNWFKKKYES